MAPSPLTEADVQRLYSLCVTAQGNPDAGLRAEAEAQLRSYCCTPIHLPHLQSLLTSPESPAICHAVAGYALLPMVTRYWALIPPEGKLSLRGSSWAALLGRTVASAEPVELLIALLTRITKLGWTEHEAFRRLPTDVHECAALRDTPRGVAVTLRVLVQLVREVASHDAGLRPIQELRVAEAFRTDVLPGLFRTGVEALRTMGQDKTKATPELCEQSLELLAECLEFLAPAPAPQDPAAPDPGDDPNAGAAYPRSWYPEIGRPGTVQLLWDLFQTTPPLSALCLRVLAKFARAPEQIFPPDQYREWLAGLLGPAKLAVVRLADPAVHAALCGLWAACPSSSALLACLAIEGWSEQMRRFSVQGLQDWRACGASALPLLRWWRHAEACGPLQWCVPEVSQAYLWGRVEAVRALQSDALRTVPPGVEAATWAAVAARQLSATGPVLVALADPLARSLAAFYNTAGGGGGDGPRPWGSQLELLLVLHWLAAVLRAPMPLDDSGRSVHAEIAALVCRVTVTLCHAAQVPPAPGAPPVGSPMNSDQTFGQTLSPDSLAAALLPTALKGLRHVAQTYFHTDARPSCGHLQRLLDANGSAALHSHLAGPLVTLVLGSRRCPTVMRAALEALVALSANWQHGPPPPFPDSGALVVSVSEILLEGIDPTLATLLYAALSGLLRPDHSVDDLLRPIGNDFMTPSQSRDRLQSLAAAFQGIVAGSTTTEAYTEVWAWLYPMRLAAMRSIFESGPSIPPPSALEFAAELCRPDGRMVFPPLSQIPVELFTEVVKWVLPGVRAGAFTARDSATRGLQHARQAALTLQVLGEALRGSPFPLGAMVHYKEPVLGEAYIVVGQAIASLRLEDLLGDRSLAAAYCTLAEVLCTAHFEWLVAQPPGVVRPLLDCLLEVLANATLRCDSTYAPALVALAHLTLSHFLHPATPFTATFAGNLPEAAAVFGAVLPQFVHHLCLERCAVSDQLAPALVACLLAKTRRPAGVHSGAVKSTAEVMGAALAAFLARSHGDGLGALAAFLGALAGFGHGAYGGLAAVLCGELDALVQASPTLRPALLTRQAPSPAAPTPQAPANPFLLQGLTAFHL